MKINNISASAIQNFSECIARWISDYEKDLKVQKRSVQLDRGVIIHSAVEAFRNPANNYDQNDYELLVKLFDEACIEHKYALAIGEYKEAKEILYKAWQMGRVHPNIPIELAQTIAVEQELVDLEGKHFQMADWPLPSKGMIDRVSILPHKGSQRDIVLLLIDEKTGWPKTHDELVDENIQAPIYFLYARKILVPMLAQQGFNVVKIIGAWQYVAHGSSVTIYEEELNHDDTNAYVINITKQMLAVQEQWNTFHENNVEPEEINHFLKKFEKINNYCGYCPRRGVCDAYQKMLQYNEEISLVGDVNWNEVWMEREKYRLIAKNADERVKHISQVISTYMQQERLQRIPLMELGKEIKITADTWEKVVLDKVAHLLGIDFVLENADISKSSIEEAIRQLKQTDPERAEYIRKMLPQMITTVPKKGYPSAVNMKKEK